MKIKDAGIQLPREGEPRVDIVKIWSARYGADIVEDWMSMNAPMTSLVEYHAYRIEKAKQDAILDANTNWKISAL